MRKDYYVEGSLSFRYVQEYASAKNNDIVWKLIKFDPKEDIVFNFSPRFERGGVYIALIRQFGARRTDVLRRFKKLYASARVGIVVNKKDTSPRERFKAVTSASDELIDTRKSVKETTTEWFKVEIGKNPVKLSENDALILGEQKQITSEATEEAFVKMASEMTVTCYQYGERHIFPKLAREEARL